MTFKEKKQFVSSRGYPVEEMETTTIEKMYLRLVDNPDWFFDRNAGNLSSGKHNSDETINLIPYEN
ncbi:MAG: hypothetical protein R2771_10965 [Saprospiraceae bacterium]